MEEKIIYVVPLDYDKPAILDDSFSKTIQKFYDEKIDFELRFVDSNNVEDSKLSAIVNHFITDCKKAEDKRPFAVAIDGTESFVLRLLKLFKTRLDYNETDYMFDVISPKRTYFKVNIPRRLINGNVYRNLLNLGPDNLVDPMTDKKNEKWDDFDEEMWGTSPSKILMPLTEEYILPSFYVFLYERNLFGDEKCNDLAHYQIGLA